MHAVVQSDQPAYEGVQSPNDDDSALKRGGQKRTWRNWVNLVAYIVNVVITYVSITGAFGETNTDLSKKYQTLVTPAGYAFSIWGLIFVWQAVWAIWQLCPPVSMNDAVQSQSPWWWATCVTQCVWTLLFAQDLVLLSLIAMLSILTSLIGCVVVVDRVTLTVGEYFLVRAPFALHLGWITCASVVNANVVLDGYKASPGLLLAGAIVGLVLIVISSGVWAFVPRTKEPIPGFVAAWALLAIVVELGDAKNLNDPARFNPYVWSEGTLTGLRIGSGVAAAIVFCMSIAAIILRVLRSLK